MLRRRAPMILVALGVTALLVWYVVYSQSVVQQLRREAERQGRIFARTYRTLFNPNADEGQYLGALTDIVQQLSGSDIPMVLVGPRGEIQDWARLPGVGATRLNMTRADSARIMAMIPRLAELNRPIVEPGVGALYYGDSQLVRSLRYIPALQAGAIAMLVAIGLYAFRARAHADREHVWAGMARESAHQLGTPLMSISGWIALLDDELEEKGDRADPMLRSAVGNMKADLERLERVAHRFERIGRPPRREPVDVVALVERMATYFRGRVPTRTHAVTIETRVPPTPVVVQGDAVLLEWVLEALTKNAVDALAGRGGKIVLSAEAVGDQARLRVADDGPGVPRELRARIFEAGYSTKERGWGIGLSLARRIVEENHGGRIALVPSDRGATFEVNLG